MNEPVPFPTPEWRQQLLALPQVEPSPALWPRIAAARREALQRRRRPLRHGLAAALALLAVLGYLLAGRDPAPRMAAHEPHPAAPVPSQKPDPELRRLDDQIALAYAHGAADEELAVLWQARAQLIESLQGPSPAMLARM